MKKWKVIGSIVFAVALAGAGSLFYLTKVKSYETTDKKVEEVVNADYQIALPGEDSDAASDSKQTETAQESDSVIEEETSEGNTPSAQSKTTVTQAKGKSAANSGNSTETDRKVGSVKESSQKNKEAQSKESESKSSASFIVEKYRPSFQNLQAQANSKIDSLVEYAYNEYQTKKKNGEDISYFYFYSKYTAAGNVLERNTDETFEYIYSALVKELKDNGYDASYATEYKAEYENAKKARQSALMNKAAEHL